MEAGASAVNRRETHLWHAVWVPKAVCDIGVLGVHR